MLLQCIIDMKIPNSVSSNNYVFVIMCLANLHVQITDRHWIGPFTVVSWDRDEHTYKVRPFKDPKPSSFARQSPVDVRIKNLRVSVRL